MVAQKTKKYRIELLSDLGSFSADGAFWVSSEDKSRLISGDFEVAFLNDIMQKVIYQSRVYDARQMTDIIEVTLSGPLVRKNTLFLMIFFIFI